MNRRLGGIVLCALLVVIVPSAEAERPRREQMRYSATDDNTYVVAGPLLVGQGAQAASYRFTLRGGERWVSVHLVDDSEEPVGGVIRQYVKTGDGGVGPVSYESRRAVTDIEFCGRTDGPQKVRRNLEITIVVFEGLCADGTPSLPTNGDIVVDFFRRR